MQGIDVARTDLNLLVVLDVLLEERNVTRAAKRLGRTQSATSHALARLRDQLGDPLLVRVGSEMRPTPKGQRLAGEVSRVLRTIGRVLAEEVTFDPTTTSRTFTIAGPDFLAAALPSLLGRMASETPNARVELVPPNPGMLRDVAESRVDLAVAPAASSRTEGLRSAPLPPLDWAVYARRGHPAIGSWGAKAWSAYPHVRVRTASSSESPVDAAARARKLVRRAGPTLPHFLLAPPLLARTDLLMTVPRAVLAEVAPRFELVALPCPVKLAPIALALFWSAHLDRDPAITWLRELATAAMCEAFAARQRAPRGAASQ